MDYSPLINVISVQKINCGVFIWLIPRLAWPMQTYEVSFMRIEKMERLIRKFLKKWLGVPKSIRNVALFCSSTKLNFPRSHLLGNLN